MGAPSCLFSEKAYTKRIVCQQLPIAVTRPAIKCAIYCSLKAVAGRDKCLGCEFTGLFAEMCLLEPQFLYVGCMSYVLNRKDFQYDKNLL